MTDFSTPQGKLERGKEYSQQQSNYNTSNPAHSHATDGLPHRTCNFEKRSKTKSISGLPGERQDTMCESTPCFLMTPPKTAVASTTTVASRTSSGCFRARTRNVAYLAAAIAFRARRTT